MLIILKENGSSERLIINLIMSNKIQFLRLDTPSNWRVPRGVLIERILYSFKYIRNLLLKYFPLRSYRDVLIL